MPVRSKENFLIFGSPRIEQDEIDEVVASMEVGWLGTGPKVARFEKDFSAYVGAPYAAACNSCTAALHLALVALGLKPGDEVITTPLTFCASVNAIIHAGCTPVLADIDPVTQNIDPECIREKITERTRAILPVHFAGRSCDMDRIMAVAREHDLKVVEDCAHAIETTWKGRHAGTFGDFGCFSFYVTKNVCTGEGGMVVAAGEDAIRHVKVLGLHGMSADAWKRFSDEGYKHYQVIEAGFKYNMMDLQAAIGIHQLKRVEQYFVRRCEIWDRYQDAFAALPLGLPAPEEPGTCHARHLYTILVDPDACGVERDEFLARITREGIGVGVHYLSIPEQPYYRERFGWTLADTPHAVRIGRQTVSLPLSAKLTDADVADVIEAVKRTLNA
ncbi:MAG: DegT/DnrJ/EryC1/StrS family aminotransferase [Pseudodesulfovibrio sp.]|uniref:Glutamine--scyllo-inositol transaminase n=1 Tax=Pseudodesulfovibrio aespoeensis (strain ATCC 700646 / DSM 10631 / Aspo-2) TaxID=643562 RepID=E6VZY1_PSEA9|nr:MULTISPECIES: DegT/DnrJ/EryC1/StrS family aminotransferase [Pseudodesulfovibrio]MBU4378486.1 DegT/DnrJ/EryC1/StrS family aminotransferase [Pseudomonadota bacterium]ADU64063.1 Glutamine--scyllo-inositol transaminase [Pseudodesulfovibrio aespoeensis Aspo-2]MBU4476541.1 DegT/DnrJ/EryC1/StrS family aminotransferase [Pseudomonadota bacterium]MBU4517399.1 DegT/DnrJ/EryC1/StrS family aminotransferase [Pseudomonadota bacterium]MBU4521999.1 DegT/DnrJ/EryC1/StrS family aminotransferase [Pseudomonadot